jgi:hypothetical protein
MSGGQRYTRRLFWTAFPHQPIWKDTPLARGVIASESADADGGSMRRS